MSLQHELYASYVQNLNFDLSRWLGDRPWDKPEFINCEDIGLFADAAVVQKRSRLCELSSRRSRSDTQE